ncbi:hypothetical protein [Luteimonas sp. FCS-9]|uniref:hypothetical protein n=1 Tax=Luteimonas sp. FCS-9 TaxID=1547516 RepID=UPI000A42EF74|nr:hypothetical protein [Luteimonas sp. FCS-9]
MKKWHLTAGVLLAAAVSSTTAFAARHHYEVIGEGAGRSAQEALEYAERSAYDQCYRGWGQSDQQTTVLAEWVDPATGYFHIRVSLGCTVDD